MFLVGYVLNEALGRWEANGTSHPPGDAKKLGLLSLRIDSRSAKVLARAVVAAPVADRERIFAARIFDCPDQDEVLAAMDWARSAGRAMCQDAIEQNYPYVPAVNLEDASVHFEGTEWLWDQWLPRGYVTILCGMPGVGKSQVSLAMAACAMGAAPWPDGKRTEAHPDFGDSVVWLDTEGSQPLLAERAKARGLPRDRFIWPEDPEQPGNPTPGWKLDNDRQFGIFTRFVDMYRPRLVVIDSLSGAHVGDENSSAMRGMLGRVADLARDTRIAFLFTHHLHKPREGQQSHTVDSIDRMRGSSAIAQFARVVMAVDTPEPDRAEWLRFRVIKNNLARMPEAIGVMLEDGSASFTTMVPEEPERHSPTTEARDFLVDYLRNIPRAPADIKKAAEEQGIAWNAVIRAAGTLGIVKRRLPGAPGSRGHGGSEWSLPAKPCERQEQAAD